MKRITIISTIMSIVATATAMTVSAQADYKFGKVTRAELERTDYPAIADGAAAIVIDELNDLLLSTDKTHPENERYYNVDRIVTRKIKILKPEGLSQASVSIVYHTGDNEYLEGCKKDDIDAYSYKLVDGRIVKKRLKDGDIRTERISDTSTRVTFTVPDAEVGGIIEYKYPKYILAFDTRAIDLAMFRDIPSLSSKIQIYVYDNKYEDCFQLMKLGTAPVRTLSGKRARQCRSIRTATPPTRHTGGAGDGFRSIFVYGGGRTMSITCPYYEFSATNLAAADPHEDAAGVRIVLSDGENGIGSE